MTNETLVKEASIFNEQGFEEPMGHDLAMTVYDFGDGQGAAVWVGSSPFRRQFRMELTGGERIALIEALGGTYQRDQSLADLRESNATLAQIREVVNFHRTCRAPDEYCTLRQEVEDLL